jgi:hypothetical protein
MNTKTTAAHPIKSHQISGVSPYILPKRSCKPFPKASAIAAWSSGDEPPGNNKAPTDGADDNDNNNKRSKL